MPKQLIAFELYCSTHERINTRSNIGLLLYLMCGYACVRGPFFIVTFIFETSELFSFVTFLVQFTP